MMLSYVQRNIFDVQTLDLWRKATNIVNAIPTVWAEFEPDVWVAPNMPDPPRTSWRELRCHEIARVVADMLGLDREEHVVDGQYGGADHTWIALDQDVITASGREPRHVLDTYACGRMPQVQLVDIHFMLPERDGYRPGPRRTDIRESLISAIITKLRAESIGQLGM